MIFGLDLAKKAGIAWLDENSNIIYVTEVTGTPEEQFLYVQNICGNDTNALVLIEAFVYFARSVKTQSSIIKRIGVVEYLLEKSNIPTELLNLQSVRAKYFKGRKKKEVCLEYFRTNHNKNLTDNHTDALLMILYYKDMRIDDNFTIRIM